MFFLNILVQILVASFSSVIYTGLHSLVVMILMSKKSEEKAYQIEDMLAYNFVGNTIMIFLFLFFTKTWLI